MSKEWLKEFYVLVKVPTRYSAYGSTCIVKKQKAPTLEKAQELVANYCTHYRKKRGFLSEGTFSVIKNPARFRIVYTFNSLDANITREKRYALITDLSATKSLVLVNHYHAGTDERDNDIFLTHIILTGDAFMRHFIESQLRFYQKENVVIDYSIQVEPYEGDAVCNDYLVFQSFDAKFFA